MKPIVKKILAPRRIEYVEIDRNFRVVEASIGAQRFADRDRELQLGRDVRPGIPELVGLEDILGEILAGDREDFELKGIARELNTDSTLYFDLYLINNEEEGVPSASASGVMLFIEDVTERTLMEQTLTQRTNEAALLYEALAAAKDYTDKIVQHMADALVVTTFAGRIKQVNQAAQNLFGYSQAELLDRSFFSFFSGSLSSSNARQPSTHAVCQGIEVTCHRKTGEEIAIAFSCSVIQSQDENIQDLVFIGRDVTLKNREREALESARQHAERASQAKSLFLANMSHEIRTPMNAVLGMAQLLSETALSAEQRDFVETIRLSSSNLLHLINQILDLSKLEAGQVDLENLDFDLSACIEEVVELLAPIAYGKGIELAAPIFPELPLLLQGDASRLRQVLTNLASNAVKFTSSGGAIVRALPVAETATTALVRLEIQDTGIGIAAEDLGKLFQPFSQVDASTTRKFGGTGLGLTICQQLVTLMGGQIGVSSEPGAGSTFWVQISFAKQKTPPPSPHEALQGKRLLAIAAPTPQRQALCWQAKRLGLGVTEATDAQEAIALLENTRGDDLPYDAIAVDGDSFPCAIPALDAAGFPDRLFRDLAFSRLPIFLILPQNRIKTAEASLQNGYDAYLFKPVRSGRLLDLLLSLLAPQKVSAPQAPASDSPEPTVFPLKILLAEDNLVNQKVALKMLERLGYEADVAANGLEVLQRLQETAYDLILMDCQMPLLDGYGATQEIHRLYGSLEEGDRNRGLRPTIIAMTANAMKEEEERCYAVGMDAYLSKPVRKERLEEVLSFWGQKLVEQKLRSQATEHSSNSSNSST